MHKACCLVSLLSMLAITVGGAIGEEVPRMDRAAIDRGQPCVNVRDYGARGDGVTDDTDAIQMAVLDATSKPLPLRGRVCVPPGIYMIKADAPIREENCPDPPDGRAEKPRGVALLSGTHFHVDPGATLRAYPTAQTHYRVLRVWQQDDVTITGGTLLGERDEHIILACSPGTSSCPDDAKCEANGMCPLGQWGFGIDVRNSSNIRIENVTAANFWGDGFMIGGLNIPDLPDNENVSVTRSVASRNRRNGLALISCKGCRVMDSTFSNTGGNPEGPGAGIDLEPSGQEPAGYAVQDSLITRCTSIKNFRGIQLGGRENAPENEVTRNVIAGNRVSRNEEDGIRISRASDNRVMNNRVTLNGGRGIWIDEESSRHPVVENLVFGNAKEGISVAGQETEIVRNIAVNNSTDLVDAHEDCDNNHWQQNVFRTSQAGATEHPACIQ
jgi:parallel beta-helix repeat protein